MIDKILSFVLTFIMCFAVAEPAAAPAAPAVGRHLAYVAFYPEREDAPSMVMMDDHGGHIEILDVPDDDGEDPADPGFDIEIVEVAEPEEETPADDPVEDIIEEPVDNVVDEPDEPVAEEIPPEEPEEFSDRNVAVSIQISPASGVLHYGDEVTLECTVHGVNEPYGISWEYSKDGEHFSPVGWHLPVYSYVMTKENAEYYYRVAVNVE